MDDALASFLGLDADELDWQADALCAQVDPEIFFPEKGHSSRPAKSVCRECAVQVECLEYALEHDPSFGVWGGQSERDRRLLRRGARIAGISIAELDLESIIRPPEKPTIATVDMSNVA